jgi:hypothetical protein
MANVTLRDDTLELGLIDGAWCDRLSPVLAERLRELIRNPR